ncbi:MAG TPA: nitronate monooxygenase family protein [Acidimicrobiales bacterium]|nr:nitronate monooxygenase family protein [Acidimicrobiales bacterium]
MSHDPLDTPARDLLGIEHPIVQAGMGYVARAELAAAVSEAGGLGVIGGAGFPPERLRLEIQRVRELTDRPFGVDLLLPSQTTSGDVLPPRPPSQRPRRGPAGPDRDVDLGELALHPDGTPVRPEELMRIVAEEEVPVFASGLGNPGPWVAQLHERGTVVLALVGNVRNARRVADAGVDVVVAQGTEGGGHTSRVATAALTPAVVAAVDVPVLAAGGIVDGVGLAAALALGAQGVWMGTRFVATFEAVGHENYKRRIVDAGEDSTVVTRSYSGKPLRTIRNAWTEDWERRPWDILPFPQQFRNSHHVYVAARRDGDTEHGSMPCGQGAAGITEVLPAGEVVRRTVGQARAVLAERFGVAAR